MAAIPYLIAFALSMAGLGVAIWYFFQHARKLSNMCCMMGGMVFGTVPGLIAGAMYSIPGSDYVGGMIVGTTVGIIIGAPMGRFGGGLGRMEGVMGAVMGGMMGGMLGYMARFFNVTLFMQYFLIAMMLLALEMTYVVHKEAPIEKKEKYPTMLMALQVLLFVLALASTLILDFSVV
ncbi:MAG TPA: hypothetical protein VGQ00_04805 [Candidatus Norongarragalinales archaeon]|jgi:hypothetical protein|nr:hypothetical protein [Candidatus Norongarragalinales archaeon]